MTAISGAIAGAISKAFSGYIHEDLNTSNIEYEYYVAAGLALVALPAFVHCSSMFEYKNTCSSENLRPRGAINSQPNSNQKDDNAAVFSGVAIAPQGHHNACV
jgi:hypothetical protein